MPDLRHLLIRLGVFSAVFLVLTAPWPGLRSTFREFFKVETRLVGLLVGNGYRVVVEDNAGGSRPSNDTRISFVESALANATQAQSSRGIVLDSRSLGWMPLAMTLALVASTPFRQRQRLTALLGCLVVVNGFVLATIYSCLHYAANTSPGKNPPLSAYANVILVDNLWVSFVFPTLVWIACTVLIRAKTTKGFTPAGERLG